MEILGVGPLELFFILIIALIVLGPTDMVKAGRTLGRFLRRLVTSPTWLAVQQTSRDLRTLPNKLMRDAGMEEDLEEMKQIGRDLNKETEMLRSLRNPLRAASEDIRQETQISSQSLSAWTTPPDAAVDIPPADVTANAAPPANPSPLGSAGEAGPAEAFPAAPENNPNQQPTEPDLS